MSAKFGTSGLRGLADELVGAVAVLHVRAFLQHLRSKRMLKRGGKVCVGLDYRVSSPALRANVQQALAAEGMSEIYYGAVPTPALAFEALRKKRPALMITGSHIPADRNGLKFYRPDGEITKADETAILARLAKLKPALPGVVVSATGDTKNFMLRYAQAFAGKPLKGMRVGVYQHSSTARDMLVDVLVKAGATVQALGRSDAFIAVDTEAVAPETALLLRRWCVAGAYDAVVSADGDGDRPLIADEKGRILRGDLVGLITARYLRARTVVTPVTSNSGLDKYLPKGVRRAKVGSPYVIAEMQGAKRRGASAIVGFEANGGFFTASRFKAGRGVLTPLPTRDCFLPILAVLACAKKAKLPLSAYATSFALPVALADRLEHFPVERSAALMQRLARRLEAVQFFEAFGMVKSFNRKDGLRALFVDGSLIHLRPSGNAPEFRCYIEAVTQARAELLLAKVMGRIAQER